MSWPASSTLYYYNMVWRKPRMKKRWYPPSINNSFFQGWWAEGQFYMLICKRWSRTYYIYPPQIRRGP